MALAISNFRTKNIVNNLHHAKSVTKKGDFYHIVFFKTKYIISVDIVNTLQKKNINKKIVENKE